MACGGAGGRGGGQLPFYSKLAIVKKWQTNDWSFG